MFGKKNSSKALEYSSTYMEGTFSPGVLEYPLAQKMKCTQRLTMSQLLLLTLYYLSNF
jgi:hypothetical protein